jgi:hypothetical protein
MSCARYRAFRWLLPSYLAVVLITNPLCVAVCAKDPPPWHEPELVFDAIITNMYVMPFREFEKVCLERGTGHGIKADTLESILQDFKETNSPRIMRRKDWHNSILNLHCAGGWNVTLTISFGPPSLPIYRNPCYFTMDLRPKIETLRTPIMQSRLAADGMLKRLAQAQK